MTRKVIVEQLKDYFALKGKVMSADEYRDAEDAPIRIQVLKRKLGSWARVMNMVGAQVTVAVSIEPAPQPEPEPEPVVEPTAEPVAEEKPAKAAPKTKGA